MKLSADIVYSELKKQYPVIMTGPKTMDMTISRPELYLDNMVDFLTDHLYLATIEHLPLHPRIQKNVVIVVIGDGAKLVHYRENCCLLIIREGANFFEVNQYICQVFDRYYEWEKQLFDIFTEAADIQDIAACSKAIFHCQINVLDASFHYLTSPDDQMFGISLDTEQISQYLSAFEVRMQQRGAFLLQLDLGEFLCVNLFGKNGVYNGTVYLSGKDGGFTPGDRTLAEFMAGLMEKAIAQNPSSLTGEKTTIKGAFSNLVNGYPLSANQKWTLNLIKEDKHFVCISQHTASRSSRLPKGYICGAFESDFAGSYAFSKGNVIVCFVDITTLTDKQGRYYSNLNTRLSKFLRETNGIAGISNGFTDPYGARIAYAQAESAVENGQLTNPEAKLYYFQSYALISMVINSIGNLPAEAYFSERLKNLIQHDKNGPISYLETLRVFLRTSMSYSQTAEELFIHRSTAVDRINRIERELDISLKDPDVRLQLEIILKAMEIEDMVHQSRS